MFSRLVPVVADISTSSLFTDEYYSTVRTDHSLYTPSSADQHVGYFHFLAVVTNAATNAHVQGVVRTWVFLLLGRQRGGDELGRVVTPCWRGCGLKLFINVRVAPMLPLSNTQAVYGWLASSSHCLLVPWEGRLCLRIRPPPLNDTRFGEGEVSMTALSLSDPLANPLREVSSCPLCTGHSSG